MNLEKRIQAFTKLGIKLGSNPTLFANAIKCSMDENPWFLEKNIQYAIDAIIKNLQQSTLETWLKSYADSIFEKGNEYRILIVMAGNIPLVGFHDFLCVLMTGKSAIIKLSSNDKYLLPAIAEQLIAIEPEFRRLITFICEDVGKYSKSVDAVIATGSDNTARYFEYYFSDKPCIIRKNRSSIAILTGKETNTELQSLADDIFLHLGLGCRSVSKLFLPKNYDFTALFEACRKYDYLQQVEKYFHNYLYYNIINKMTNTTLYTNGFCIFIESEKLTSPLAVVHYEFYNRKGDVSKIIAEVESKLQCVVGGSTDAIPFGKAQRPELWDYADNVDTVQWLIGL